MRQFWIVPGSEKNWKQALTSKGIWGLEQKTLDKVYWLALAPNDLTLFYVTGKVKGIVGYGIIRSKFYQDVPLWDAEIREGRVKWPLRFEFDVGFILPENRWTDERILLAGGGHFRQPLILQERNSIRQIVRELNPNASIEELLDETSVLVPSVKAESESPTHNDIKNLLLEIGKLQGYVANPEFPMETERLDVVWRRLPESGPTYGFEVQISCDLYHALGKLKHAHDIWNSRIFLVASANDLGSVNQLLSGTFHEIKTLLKFIEIERVQSLYQSKQNIYQIEKELGLIP
ncbi:MAG: EVE domain-containing protein [Methanophagales archaeon]|nr:EVE domain-containing protein [Methanophagales archaeon]